jgi:thiol:disulfide interchange protein
VLLCVGALLISPTARPSAQTAHPQAPPAKQVLDTALAAANTANKNVFVFFSASWCGWCHKLEAFLKTPDGAALGQYAVFVKLTVQESGEFMPDENPGGADMMKAWGGTGGIPYYVFLDGKGIVLSDANGLAGGANIGYPANPAEVKAFDVVLTKGVPKMPADVRAKIIDYITKHP